MAVTSLSFVFVFLPLSILAYYLLPQNRKSGGLFLLSILFYGLLDWLGLILMILSLTLDYLLVGAIHRLGREHRLARPLCKACVVKSILLLVAASASSSILHVPIPLGLFIYTLTSLGYVVDCYRGEAPFEEDPLVFGAMCCFFGKLYCGPLVEYGEIAPRLKNPACSLNGIGEGILQFVRGLAKKIILADNILQVYYALDGVAGETATVLGSWALVFSAVFSVYFTLSSYCDMAMGLGKIFGFELPQNFSYPLQSRTVTDFFARFNITVSRYIRRYVYRFLGYDTGGRLSNSLNLLLTAMLAALWFGLRLETLAWGMFLGAFMIFEALWGGRIFSRIPPFFLRVYAFSVVLISFSIYAGDSLGGAWERLVVMIGLGGAPFISPGVQYVLASHGLVIALCFILSTSLCNIAGRWLSHTYPLPSKVVAAVANLALLTVTVAFMI